MKKRKIFLVLSVLFAIGTMLSACANNDNEERNKEDTFSVAMVTDIGGIEDKSFNQSAWEGLQAFGKENGLKKGKDGYDYVESKSEADYSTNLNNLVRQGFDLVFGIGYGLQGAIDEIANQQKEAHFAIIDSEVDQPNVASVLFKEQEGSFLAGIVAGLATKSNQIGFIGGVEGAVIERFEAGFLAGVKSVNPNAKVDVQYAGAWDKAEVGKTIASKMYSSGADVVFHAAGGTGKGLFTEARDLKKKDPAKEIWAIGVDSDQSAEGVVEVDGKKYNIVLTSALKRVNNAVIDLSNQAKDGKFPGGKKITYGLADNGVGLSAINDALDNKADIEQKVEEYSTKIKNGDLKIPSTLDELKSFKVE